MKERRASMEHFLICGERHCGKTTLIERLKEQSTVPIYGVTTRIMRARPDGYHEIYIFPADDGAMKTGEFNHLANCNGAERAVRTELFDTLGVQFLERARPGGILFLDELGFMEAEAQRFCDTVLRCFDGDIPVIATTRPAHEEVAFLKRLDQHPIIRKIRMTAENREQIYEELLQRLHIWCGETVGGAVQTEPIGANISGIETAQISR